MLTSARAGGRLDFGEGARSLISGLWVFQNMLLGFAEAIIQLRCTSSCADTSDFSFSFLSSEKKEPTTSANTWLLLLREVNRVCRYGSPASRMLLFTR